MKKQFLKPKNAVLYTALALGTIASLSSCKKDSTSTTTPITQTISGTLTFTDDEEKYDRVIETVAYGLLDLSQIGTFRDIVNEEIAKQFDGDDNVLLKTLSEKCQAKGIDLKAVMALSLNKYNKKELVPLLEEAINGVSYFGRTIYPQVFIPFINDVNINTNPVIALNYTDEDTLNTIISVNNGTGSGVGGNTASKGKATATSAQLNLHWVVSVNETVGNDGRIAIRETPIDPVPIRATLTPGRKYWHLEFRRIWIDQKKEGWGNGRADISFIANHYKPGCAKDEIASLPMMKVANADLHTWLDPGASNCSACATHVIAAWEDDPRRLWEDNESIPVLIYEADVRQSFGKTISLMPSCNNDGIVYPISKEDIYGIVDAVRDESVWVGSSSDPSNPYSIMPHILRSTPVFGGMSFELEGGRHQ